MNIFVGQIFSSVPNQLSFVGQIFSSVPNQLSFVGQIFNATPIDYICPPPTRHASRPFNAC
jgi:hypothetical protein